jgi:phthalate 4,5-cis-dihydrodiol dehydrogenase
VMSAPVAEHDRQKNMGLGGRILPAEQPFLPHFGKLVVTGERGDLSLSSTGLVKFDVSGKHEIPVPRGVGRPGHGDALDELWAVIREGRDTPFTARWGKATLEVALAILESSRERRDIQLKHQVAC